MALITCHECGKEISSEALTCPGCGVQTMHAKKTNEKVIKSTKKQNIISLYIICIIIILAAGGMIYGILSEPKPDYERFLSAMSYVVENNDYIDDVVINERNRIDVIISNAWWNSTSEAKNKFAKNIYETTYLYAYDNNLIHKNNSVLFVSIYDQDGIKVAKADSFGIDILK